MPAQPLHQRYNPIGVMMIAKAKENFNEDWAYQDDMIIIKQSIYNPFII